jgi:hypothetical protein
MLGITNNVYVVFGMLTPKESNFYTIMSGMKNNNGMVRKLTPKESNVYSQNWISLHMCDSVGVECGYKYHVIYKHAIPSGLNSQT